MNYGFNRRNFVEEILNERYGGDECACAKALDINVRYFRELIYHTDKDIGMKTTNKIFSYCQKNGLNHEKFILV